MLIGGVTATIGGIVGFLISKKMTNANFDIQVEKAKEQTSTMENEEQHL